jgi:hypothetical protein
MKGNAQLVTDLFRFFLSPLTCESCGKSETVIKLSYDIRKYTHWNLLVCCRGGLAYLRHRSIEAWQRTGTKTRMLDSFPAVERLYRFSPRELRELNGLRLFVAG